MYNRHEYSGPMKKCKKCNIEKPLTDFCNRKGEEDGKHRYCKPCLNQNFKTYYHTSGRKESDYYKTYRDQNKEYFNQYCNNHYHTKKELYREWNKNQYHTDISFRIKHVTSARINEALKTYQTLKRNRTIEYLGCNMDEYTQYLEYQFTSEMNWDNYGEYWEIDHIKPVDSFDLNNEENLYKCFHYLNTQPLEKTKNREKSNKY
jgi:hypothetical protein